MHGMSSKSCLFSCFILNAGIKAENGTDIVAKVMLLCSK